MTSGTLFLVVGPSGSGKDTLMDGARAYFAGDPGLIFARRVITRPATAGGEDHCPATPEAFARRRAAGGFLSSWHAHGLDYGLSAALLDDLSAGRDVVANVSRTVLADLGRRVPRALVVNITAPPEVLARRLAARGRETAADIAERLAREVAAMPADVARVSVVNDGTVAEGIARFVACLEAGRAGARP